MLDRGILPAWMSLPLCRPRRHRSSILAGLAILLGSTVLVGWAAGLPLLTCLLPGWPAMQPLAAVSFLLAGAALYLYGRHRFRAAAVPLLALFLIVGGNLLQSVIGRSFGIDTWLFREAVLAQAGNPFPGRIYGITAVELLLFGACLVLPRRRPRQYRRIGHLATLGLGLAFANLSGYVLDARAFAGIGGLLTMAAPAAIGLIMLFCGVLQTLRGKSWLFLLAAPSAGGRAARRLLPLVLGWPLAAGLAIYLAAPFARLPQQTLILALMTVMLLQAALVLRFSWQLHRAEVDRLAADAALREGEERYRIVVETATEGIITIERHGRIVFANAAAAQIFGYPVAEMQDLPLAMLMPEGERAPYQAALAEYLATGRKRGAWGGIETHGRHRSGRDIPIEVSYGEFRKNGEPLFIGIVRDITERKRAEAALLHLHESLEQRVRERTAELSRTNEALMRSNQELERVAYIASHDLQTPLRSITGFVQLLQRNYQGRLDERADDWIRLVVENTHRLQTLIQELLAYAQLDSQVAHFVPTDFGRLFEEVVAALAAPIRATRAQVSRGHLPEVMGNRMQLRQVLYHLVDNAIKFHGEAPPRVHVAAEPGDGEWLFSVQDNGIGIAPRHHERIFEIFRRLHTQQAYPGSGLGLAVCRRVIHNHGGRIWVESEPGQGSTFRFTLPDRALTPAGTDPVI